jgi:MEMO1 family protein
MRNDKRKFLLITFTGFILLIFFALSLNFWIYPKVDILGYSNLKSSHNTKFFIESFFYKGVSDAKINYKKSDYEVAGGIVPHDLLPGFILADFYSRLIVQDPSTIVILGPNHYEKGDYKFLTGTYDWHTPFGLLSTDQKIVNKLVDDKLIGLNEEVISNDHSVGSSLPYIKFYLPNTKVVPILVSGFTSKEEAGLFVGKLLKVIDEKTVLVSAVDFSHYLNSKQARDKDRITLEIIKDYDYRSLFSLNNDYMDSPASVGILLMTMQKLGKSKMEVIHNTNSGILQKNEHIETTSYFSIAYF